MRHRSFGVTTLAFATLMVGIYSQYAAISLLLTGSVFTAAGSIQGAVTLITGAVFLGLTASAYLVGFGLWTRRHFSWAGAIVVFAVLIGANLFLSVLATNFISAVVPLVGSLVALWYLQRPAVKAELLGTSVPLEVKVAVGDGMEGAQPAR